MRDNHLRSLITSPDGQSVVQNIIASSNSYKFYAPRVPSIDETYDLPAFGVLCEIPIVQELFAIVRRRSTEPNRVGRHQQRR